MDAIHYLDAEFFSGIFTKRDKFSHKGNYGHALLIAGSYGKMGSAVLASRACMRSGAGLLTVHIPGKGYDIMQISVPEAMCSVDTSDVCFSGLPLLEKYTAIGVGPGLGLDKLSTDALRKLLESKPTNMVIDADALNLLAKEQSLLSLLPENAILTPHYKEFERLAGVWDTPQKLMQLQLDFSRQYKVIVVLKSAGTCISSPTGDVWVNTSGNPGMATAGSGDVLTGVILALLAQNFTPLNAALAGVYVHGIAGDFAELSKGEISLIASDLVDSLGNAFREITNE